MYELYHINNNLLKLRKIMIKNDISIFLIFSRQSDISFFWFKKVKSLNERMKIISEYMLKTLKFLAFYIRIFVFEDTWRYMKDTIFCIVFLWISTL